MRSTFPDMSALRSSTPALETTIPSRRSPTTRRGEWSSIPTWSFWCTSSMTRSRCRGRRSIWLIDRSYLIAFLTNRLDGVLRKTGSRPGWKAYYASLYNENLPGYQACQAALLDLAATTRENQTKLIVALLPELHEINQEYPFTAEHQKIKDVVAPTGAPVLDLIDGLRGHGPEETLWVTPLDDHPSAQGQYLDRRTIAGCNPGRAGRQQCGCG